MRLVSLSLPRPTSVIAALTVVLLAGSLAGCHSCYEGPPPEPGSLRHVIRGLQAVGVETEVTSAADGSDALVTSTGGEIVDRAMTHMHYDWIILSAGGIVGAHETDDPSRCHVDVEIAGETKTLSCGGSCGVPVCSLDGEWIPNVGYKVFCSCK